MAGRVEPTRRRGYTRVSAKNQVTLPQSVLRQAHLAPGDELRVDVTADGAIRLSREKNPLDELIGSAPGLSADTDLQGMRGEWPR